MRDTLLPNLNILSGLNLFLNILVENYLNHSYCACIITRNLDKANFWHTSLPVLTIDYDESTFDENFFGCIESNCASFFIMADVFQEFHDSFLKSHDKADQRVAEKYVLIISHKAEIPQYRLDRLVIQEIPNLLYLSTKTAETFDLYTFDDRLELKVKDCYDTKTRSFLFKNELYPSFVKHLNSRSIRVGAIFYLPNAYFQTVSPGAGQVYNMSNPDDDKTILMDGTESRVILELCKTYNCTILMNFVEGMWGEIDENGDGNGMVRSLVVHESDVGYAALYPWTSFGKFLSISSPISKNEVTCLVPRPKLRPYYLTPILPFPLVCWLALLVSFVALLLSLKLTGSVHRIIEHNTTEDNSWIGIIFTVISVFLLQSHRRRYRKISKVLVFCVMVVIGIVLDNIYSGGLAAVLTVPHYEKPIETALGLANSDLQWAGYTDVWIFSIRPSTQPTIIRLLKSFVSMEIDELLKRSTQADIAIVAERGQFGHVAVSSDFFQIEAARKMQLMREGIYWDYCVMYTPKTFPFQNVLNNMILWIAQTGIQSYWEYDVFALYVDQDTQQTILHAKDKADSTLVRLQLEHFLGAFIVLGIGCSYATLVFILELAVDWWKRKRSNVVYLE